MKWCCIGLGELVVIGGVFVGVVVVSSLVMVLSSLVSGIGLCSSCVMLWDISVWWFCLCMFVL